MLFSKPIFLKNIGSTNEEVKKLAKKGESQGLVIVATKQTKGKGTKKRKWFSPKGGLWFSVLLRNEKRPELLPVIASLAVANALKKEFPELLERIRVKWMNDVCIDRKKTAGILCKSFFFGKESFSTIGIGVNTNIKEFPKSLAGKSTSIFIETGKRTKNKQLLEAILKQFQKLQGKTKESLWKQYCKRNLALGSEAFLKDGRNGIIKEINKNFNLVIFCMGKKVKAEFGEVKKIKLIVNAV